MRARSRLRAQALAARADVVQQADGLWWQDRVVASFSVLLGNALASMWAVESRSQGAVCAAGHHATAGCFKDGYGDGVHGHAPVAETHAATSDPGAIPRRQQPALRGRWLLLPTFLKHSLIFTPPRTGTGCFLSPRDLRFPPEARKHTSFPRLPASPHLPRGEAAAALPGALCPGRSAPRRPGPDTTDTGTGTGTDTRTGPPSRWARRGARGARCPRPASPGVSAAGRRRRRGPAPGRGGRREGRGAAAG